MLLLFRRQLLLFNSIMKWTINALYDQAFAAKRLLNQYILIHLAKLTTIRAFYKSAAQEGTWFLFFFSFFLIGLAKGAILLKKKIKNKKYRLHSNCVAGSSLRAFDRSLVITTVLLCKEADTWIISYSFVSSGQLAREHDCNWSQAESIQPLTANSLVSGKLWSIERDRFFRKRAVISDLRPKGSIARLRYNPATEVIQWQMRLANCYDYLHVEG